MVDSVGEDGRQEPQKVVDQINKRAGRNMPQAVGTAVLLIGIILACLLTSIQVFVILIVVFMVLALWELRVDFATVGLHIPVITLWLCSAGMLLSSYYAPRHAEAMAMSSIIALFAVVVMSTMRVTYGNHISLAVAGKLASSDPRVGTPDLAVPIDPPHHSRMSNLAVSVFSLMYVPVLAGSIILSLTFHGHPVAHAIMLVFLPALSDTGGLFAGAWFGKHKLSPRISPKKSVEGLIGSIALAMLGAFVIFAVTYPGQWSKLWWAPIVMGVMVGIVGTFGDLCASMLKRDIGIKDMGHLLKGHGGVMDRVDSILLSAPFLTVLLWMTGM